MRRLLNLYESILVVLTTSMLALFTIVVAYQVFSRYVDFVPRFMWTEEISRFSFIWMLFLGAAVAVRKKTHFVIDLFPQSVQERYGRLLDLFVLLIVLGVAVSMVVGGVRFVEMGVKRISTTSGIMLSWIYLSIPVSGASMIIFCLEQMWDTWMINKKE
jgi:TRAP-type transport system small permease protein